MNLNLNIDDQRLFITLGALFSVLISILTVVVGPIVPIFVIIITSLFFMMVIVCQNPFVALVTNVAYCFVYLFLSRELAPNIPFGYLIEMLYMITWVGILVNIAKGDIAILKNDLVLLFSIWFLISVLQLLNPMGPNPRGWLHEIRTSGLNSFLLIPSGFLLFRTIKHLNIFIYIIIGFSLLATMNGLKQVYLGPFPGELEFLTNSPTHSIWGKIRVFSFFSDAGQFGASQAHLSVICGVLAMGPFRKWKRIVLAGLCLLFFYGMLISGTRGALFALIPGCLLAIFLFKNIKVLMLGFVVLLVFIAGLKYTHIGSSNYHVYRMRTALNPEDASLNVRFKNQELLRNYLKDYPIGGGLGIIGYAGHEYNSDKYLSTIEPDSYWVKVWAMYGIVGFTIWFSMILYITGKCCGIVWNIKNQKLRVKLIALTSGFWGIFICSYGNEVINSYPSSIVAYLSLVFIYLGPRFDLGIKNRN